MYNIKKKTEIASLPVPTGLLTWQLRMPLAWDGVLTPSKFNKKTTLQVDSEIVSTLPFSSTLLASLMQALWPDPSVMGEASDKWHGIDNVWERGMTAGGR